jgi:hypothetical protein
MKIPMYTADPAVDFMPFMNALEEEHSFSYHDCAGKYKWIHNRQNELCKEWDIDYSVWGKIKPSEMTGKDKEFYEVYQEEVHDETKQPPYQDFWHWLLDNDFCELHRGGFNYLSFWSIDDDETPEWVKRVLELIKDAVKDNPAYDGESLNCYVDW